MVGGGIFDAKDTFRNNKDLFSKWINFSHLKITKVDPKKNILLAEDGNEYSYEHLVIASGIVNDFS